MDKRKLTLVALLSIAVLALSSCNGSHSQSSVKVLNGVSKELTFKGRSSDPADSAKSVPVNHISYPIISSNAYSLDAFDNSWAGANVTIDQVNVIKTKAFEDKRTKKMYEGVVLVHFKIRAAREITIYPTRGFLNTSDGQHEVADASSSDQFDGTFSAGKEKEGFVLWTIPKMSSPSSIKSLQIVFSADYKLTDDSKLAATQGFSNKTYNFKISL